MLVLHGVAVLVTVVVGTGAERLVRWVNDELVARLTLPPAVPAVAGRTRLGTPWRTGTVVPALCLRVGPSRRGPPPGSSLLGVLPA